MKIKITALLLLISLVGKSQNLKFDWITHSGETPGVNIKSAGRDNLGNFYLAGHYQGTVDFDPTEDKNEHTSNGLNDFFILKMDQGGKIVWVRTIGGTENEIHPEIAVDNLGNIFMTGYFKGTVDFDPGLEIIDLVSLGGEDIFILKLNTSGAYEWAYSFGSESGNDRGIAVTTDTHGDAIFTGYFLPGSVDFDPGPGKGNLSEGMYIVKFTSSGSFTWAKSFSKSTTASQIRSYKLATDISDNIYLTGTFRYEVDFDPGIGVENMTSMAINMDDVFVVKLDPTGDLIWNYALNGSQHDTPNSIAVNKGGEVALSGHFQGSIFYDLESATSSTSNGHIDAFILKLTDSGKLQWIRTHGGVTTDIGQSIAFDKHGDIFAGGEFRIAVEFDPNESIFEMTTKGAAKSTYLLKLKADGSFVWATQLEAQSSAGLTGLAEIFLDSEDDIHIAGHYIGPIDFDPDHNTDIHTAMGNDYFLLKMSQNNLPSLDLPIPNQLAPKNEIFSYQIPSNAFIDLDGDELTYAATQIGDPTIIGWVTFDAATRTLSGTPTANHVGTTIIEIEVNDGEGMITEQFDLTVTNTNAVPIIANPIVNQSIPDNKAYSFQIPEDIFSDSDGDQLSYSITKAPAGLIDDVTLPSWLSFDNSTRTLSGNPSRDLVGDYTLRVLADDLKGGTITETFILSVFHVNLVPNVTTPFTDVIYKQGFASAVMKYAESFDDEDNDPLTFSVEVSDPKVVSAVLTTDELIITEVGLGSTEITILATDGNKGSVSETFAITVEFVLNAPVLNRVIVYPVPSRNYLMIEPIDKNASIRVLSMMGKEMTNINMLNISNSSMQLDISQLTKGSYFLMLDDKGKTLAHKFIVVE